MSRYTINVCDLCKIEKEEFYIINIKKPGKTKANNFDICIDCATKIQQQLTANPKNNLSENWIFEGPKKNTLNEDLYHRGDRFGYNEQPQSYETDVILRKTLETSNEISEDELLMRKISEAKKRQQEHSESTPSDQFDTKDTPIQDLFSHDGTNLCSHMNRSQPEWDIVDDKKVAYSYCLACRAKIPVKTLANKRAYFNERRES